MSYPSEQGRDDGSLPPVNVVVPDDARELERDVLAYRRELRARRRRERLLRMARPFSRTGFGGPAALMPLIAVCLALTLVGGALLSVATISPAQAPTRTSSPPPSAQPSARSSAPPSAARSSAAASAGPDGLTSLPAGNVRLDGRIVSARSLTSSVIALVPADCGCDQALRDLVAQASAAGVPLYFVASGAAIAQLAAVMTSDGGATARPTVDPRGVFRAAYRPDGLLVLLVYRDATAEVRRDVSAGFRLGTTRAQLLMAAPGQTASAPAVSSATPD